MPTGKAGQKEDGAIDGVNHGGLGAVQTARPLDVDKVAGEVGAGPLVFGPAFDDAVAPSDGICQDGAKSPLFRRLNAGWVERAVGGGCGEM